MALVVWMPHGAGSAFEGHLRAALDDSVRLTVSERAPEESYRVLVSGRPEAAWIRPGVERVVIPFAGVPPTTLALLRAHPATCLHNLHHNAVPTAELAVGLLIAAARGIVPADRALRDGDWTSRYEEEGRGLLLEGRRALVLGYGSIGRRVGRALEGLAMDVVGLRRRDGLTALDRELPRSDVLVVSLPSTSETRGLFDRERLGRLREGAVLVNVSRGDVFDEGALHEALVSRRIAGAGLDVWWRYPKDEASRRCTPPSAFDFAALDNVVLSPHRAGHTDRTERLRAGHLADLLLAAARGDAVPHAIDLDRGY